MAAGLKVIKIVLGANTTEFTHKFHEAQHELHELGESAHHMSKAMKVALAGVAAGVASFALLGEQLKEGVSEAVKWQTANAKLASTAKNAGFAASEFVHAVDESAEALQRRTGVSKFDIAAADDLIARNIRVAQTFLGSGKRIEETNQILVDLARRMGVDAPAAAATLGRALASPEKAAGALRRAKIFLTDTQNAELKALVKGGHTVEAQHKLYEDLAGQVKGAADAYGKTLPGQLEIAKRNFGEFREELGVGLIPILTSVVKAAVRLTDWARSHKQDILDFAHAVGDALRPAFEAVGDAVDKGRDALAKVGPALQSGLAAVGPLIDGARDAFGKLAPAVGDFVGHLQGAAGQIGDLAQSIAQTLGPVVGALVLGFEDLLGAVGPPLLAALGALADAVGAVAGFLAEHQDLIAGIAIGITVVMIPTIYGLATAWAAEAAAATAAAALTAAAWVVAAAPAALLVAAIALVVVGFIEAWKHSQKFRDIVIGAWNAVVSAVGAAVKFLIDTYARYVDLVLLGFQKILEGLGHLPSWLGGGAADSAAAAIAALRANIAAAVDGINADLDRITTDITIGVHVVFTDEQKRVGVNQSDLNEAQNEKGARARNAARDAADAAKAAAKAAADAVHAAAVPSIGNLVSDAVAGVGGAGGGGGAAAKKAKTVKAAVKTGQDILDGFLSGMRSRFPGVSTALQAWSDRLPVRLGHGLDGVVKAAEKGLNRLQKAIDANSKRLEVANQRLTDAKARLADYSTTVRAAINDLGDLGTHGGATFEIVRDRLAQTLNNAKDFAATIAGLRKAGLNDTALQQLIAAGPGIATQTGKAILQGGTKGIAQINQMQGQLDRVAKATGATVANQFFAAGVRQAQGVVEGLKSRAAVLKAQMKALGDAVVAAIVAGLHLKATSSGLKIAGHRAAGGPVVAGRSYLVGERGIEVFTPRTSGAIVANGALAAAAAVPSFEVHVWVGDREITDIVRTEVRAGNRAVRSAVAAGARRAVA